MKEMLFSKDESNFIKGCLQNEIDWLKIGLYAQDMEIANRIAKREKECQRLIKKFDNAEKKIKVASAKGKGRGLQYWVCERIAKMFGIDFVQSDDTCLVHSRSMGLSGTDIVLTGELAEKFPFAVECKACETLSIAEWVRQARNNVKENQDYLLVFKKQTIGSEPVVLMDWSCFENIFRKTLK